VRAEATKHDRPGRKCPSSPAGAVAAVATIRGASELGGRNITKYLQARNMPREKSLFADEARGADPHPSVGKADDAVEETGASTTAYRRGMGSSVQGTIIRDIVRKLPRAAGTGYDLQGLSD
jgi:hypothetical protein